MVKLGDSSVGAGICRVAEKGNTYPFGAQKNILYADLDGNFSHLDDPVVDGMKVQGGMITLPEKPGLGSDIDPAYLKKLKRI